MHNLNISTYLAAPWRARGDGRAEAPIILIKEGVLFGSDGPVFWPADTLRKNPSQWNNKAVTLQHPFNEKNEPVSVHSSNDIERKFRIGFLENVYFDESIKGLRGTAIIPMSIVTRKSLQDVREVSVGLFPTMTFEQGEFNDEWFHAQATDYKPDHLALLPDKQGACSWEDGCGIRTNAAGVITLSASDLLLPAGILVNQQDDADEVAKWEKAGLLMPPALREALFEQQKQKSNQSQNQPIGEILFPTPIK